MHATEALLAAFEATGHVIYLDRAEKIARRTSRCGRRSCRKDWSGSISAPDWSIDWHYNESDSSNIFRPWGFQPGHQTEWAKLLLILERHRALPWLRRAPSNSSTPRFNRAWDDDHGGLYYGFGPDGTICDHDKYFWVQAETFADRRAARQAHGPRALLGLLRRDLAL